MFGLSSGKSAVSAVEFVGTGSMKSIMGSYVVLSGFKEGDITGRDADIILDAAKAAWLNALGDYATVTGAVARLSAEDFDRAYLCNLDVTKDGASATFKITGITVGDDSVDVTVSLVRTNPLLAQDGETPAPIKGVLRFYGAATLEAFASGAASTTSVLSEERFGGGTTEATETFRKVDGNVTNSFFNVKIEER